jgi:serine/threonine-protein kinase
VKLDAGVLNTGDTIAGYRIEGLLGHGGMGIVYRATQLSLDRVVALKVVSPRLAEDPEFRERFRREGRIQAALEHPNIITIHEAGETDAGLFIAMRLVEGSNLKELLLAEQLSPARGVRLLRQVAEALDAAHEAGLVHRDIKPQNILVGARDHAYLADFGLTRPPGQRGLTQTGHFVGSLDYISPEQIHGGSPEPHSDIYAFGAVLYECLTGSVPYPRDSEAAVLFAHLTDPLPPASTANRDLPEAVDPVIAAALNKDPSRRPHAAADLIERIERAAAGRLPETVPPSTPVSVPDSDIAVPSPAPRTVVDRRRTVVEEDLPAPHRRARRAVIAGIGAVAVLTAGGYLVGATRSVAAAPPKAVVQDEELSFALPTNWIRERPAKSRYGMTLAGAQIASNRSNGGAAMLTVGWVNSTRPSLVPSVAAEYALTIDPAQPRLARLAAGQAYAYRGADRHLIAFFLPTTRGTLAAVCEDALRSASELERCTSVVTSIALKRAKALPPGPTAMYANAVRSALGAVSRVRGRELPIMRTSKRAAAQAAAAARIAATYRKSAAALVVASQLDSRSEAATAALVDALTRAATAYDSAAKAARSLQPTPYRAASAAVARTERAVTKEVEALRALGYRVVG